MRSGSHGDGVDGEHMSDRGLRSSFESNAYTTTTNISSVYDDDMTTTDNDDIARRATHAGHDLDCPSPECGAIQAAGTIPSDESVPAHGLMTMHGHAAATAGFTAGYDSQASCTGYSTLPQAAPVGCNRAANQSSLSTPSTTRRDKVERTGTQRKPEA